MLLLLQLCDGWKRLPPPPPPPLKETRYQAKSFESTIEFSVANCSWFKVCIWLFYVRTFVTMTKLNLLSMLPQIVSGNADWGSSTAAGQFFELHVPAESSYLNASQLSGDQRTEKRHFPSPVVILSRPLYFYAVSCVIKFPLHHRHPCLYGPI